jgi:formyl-CoA transferase
MVSIDRQDIADDLRFAQNAGRIENDEEIDTAIDDFAKMHTLENLLTAPELQDLPSGPIYTITDIVNAAQYAARCTF